jgi:adenine-specific DNA-methyltransferase
MMPSVTTTPMMAGPIARDLGPRGSRAEVANADPAAGLPSAARQVLAAVPLWWAARAEARGLSGRWLDVNQALELEPPDGLDTSVALDSSATLALTGYDLGAAYVAALSPQVRARHGRHYTPELMAKELWAITSRALGLGCGVAQPLPGLIRDPACGAGALLLPALDAHLAAMCHGDPQMTLAGLPHLIEGIDADPAAVWLANVVLAAQMMPLLATTPIRRRRPLPVLARVGDGLQPNQIPARAVVMNPPYGRVRLSPEERERFAATLYGHANLYGLFLAAALEGLDEHRGVLGAVVPTSFTAGLYFRNLRAVIAKTAPLREAVFVVERGGVFAGVLQETCLAVFSRRRSQTTTIGSLNGSRITVARVKSPHGEGPWLLPRRCDDASVAAAAIAMPLTLARAGWRASTGPLVWNRRRADLCSRPGPHRVPVLWAADLDGGVVHRDAIRNHLRYLKLREPSDSTVMVLTEPAVLVQRTTAPEQARRLVACELTTIVIEQWGGAVVVENHVNVLRPTTVSPLLTHGTLARVLATETLDKVMRCMSGSVAVSAYELEALPLPSADVLCRWEVLNGESLDLAVAAAYLPEPR